MFRSLPTLAAALILGIGYPWFIQTIEVDPDEQDKERPYIAANIEATRHAFGIDEAQAEYIAEIRLRNLNKRYVLNAIADVEKLEKELGKND